MKKVLILLVFSGISVFTYAQKFGYVNSQELLVSMTEVKAADTELETYQKQLMAVGQGKVAEFETEYKKYAEDAQKGILSQVQVQAKESELAQKQEEIQKYEYEVQSKLSAKREELYKPILDKVKMVIETYGKENGYTMIFDSSAGTILHAVESDNLITPLKAKLGVQ
ncbi:MAG: OmpH family outer membrane protein [Saprospiraceae bacterium]|nr:OmpH family outer membrane protein [Saprospiraceae bacterium]